MSLDLNLSVTLEQLAEATFISLQLQTSSLYRVGLMDYEMATGDRETAPLDVRKKVMTSAYKTVIDRLPDGSPFAAPLLKIRDSELAKMTE